MVTIRPFEPGDYEAVTRVWNQVIVNHQVTAEQMEYDDATVEPPRRAARLVADDGGTIVGGAQYEQRLSTYHPDKYYLHVYVDPERQREGIGAALYDTLKSDLDVFDPLNLRCDVRQDHPHALRFAQKRGYVQDKLDWQMLLDLAAFHPEAHRPRLDRVGEQGLRIASMTELGDTPEVQRMFYDVFCEARRDVPRTEPATDMTFEQFELNVFNAPDYLPAGTYLALDEGRAVGLTMSWTAADPPELHTGLTAVLRSHRGRGIAGALKVAALSWAKADGRVKAVSDNDVNNVEMLAVNHGLGYEKQPAIISLVNVLRT